MEKRNDALVVEMFLRMWEAMCFMEQLHAFLEGKEVDPAMKHAAAFRDYLLQHRPGEAFDEKRFVPANEAQCEYTKGIMAAAPALVADWVWGSKRIFRPSAEMQERFTGIKFGNLRFSDLQLPFPIFGVQLANPLPALQTDYGFMFVWLLDLPGEGPLPDRRTLNFVALPQMLKGYGGLDPERCRKALRDLKDPKRFERGRREALDLATQHGDLKKYAPHLGFLSIPLPWLESDVPIEHFLEAAPKANPWLHDWSIAQVRIALNLCLYLQSLPPGAEKEEGVHWKAEYLPKRERKAPQPVISTRTEVCDIIGHHIIDGMVVDKRSAEARAGGWEMEPMWRRAHSRRPPGKGNDPTAEKSVKVRHYLIREDLAAQGHPIRGSLAEVR